MANGRLGQMIQYCTVQYSTYSTYSTASINTSPDPTPGSLAHQLRKRVSSKSVVHSHAIKRAHHLGQVRFVPSEPVEEARGVSE